jgi:recombination associated protein RdgC
MGALSGSISIRRYRVTDPLPADPRARLSRGLRSHGFTPLDPKGDVDKSVGWVSMLDYDDADLRADKLFFVASGGEQLRVALRIDVLKPPPAEVKRQLRARAAAMEAAEGRQLTRREKGVLKEEVVRQLRQSTLPRVKTIDMVWNLDSGQLYFWSQTKSVNELFVNEFVRAFGLRLDIDGPGRWTRRSGAAELLAKLEPTPELWQGFAGLRPLAADSSSDGEGR